MAPAQEATGRCYPWPKDALRISFGIIWLIDAVLKWLPGFRSGYMGAIMGEAQGQPGWLTSRCTIATRLCLPGGPARG